MAELLSVHIDFFSAASESKLNLQCESHSMNTQRHQNQLICPIFWQAVWEKFCFQTFSRRTTDPFSINCPSLLWLGLPGQTFGSSGTYDQSSVFLEGIVSCSSVARLVVRSSFNRILTMPKSCLETRSICHLGIVFVSRNMIQGKRSYQIAFYRIKSQRLAWQNMSSFKSRILTCSHLSRHPYR